MNRRSSMGALHPVLFMVMVYAISVVLAFFVCNVIYSSLHQTSSVVQKSESKIEGYTALK